ncbi:MAG TPA: hypothetical protein VK662_02755 [Acidothermaceae bacterium]|jgi:hypothetical protein|nr:hypothetical protein [Acidothermaceae bacterium]
MTFFAYGYLQAQVDVNELRVRVGALDATGGPVVVEEPVDTLHNFPPDLIPQDGSAVCFSIYDGPGRRGAQYLLSDLDFAPDADIGLPTQALQRLKLLTCLLNHLLAIPGVRRLAIALTDFDEIERIAHVSAGELERTIAEDCSNYTPPNVLYVCDLP